MKFILAKYDDLIAGQLLNKFDDAAVFLKKRAYAFLIIDFICIALFPLIVLINMPPSSARQLHLAVIYSILTCGHIVSIMLLKSGRYTLSVDSILWLYVISWYASSISGMRFFLDTGINDSAHLIFIILFLAGLFGSMITFGISTFLLIGGMIAHAVLSKMYSTGNVYYQVMTHVLDISVSMMSIFIIFFVIRRTLEGAFTNSEDELEKNINIMHALEETISRQTQQLLNEKNMLKELNREYEMELNMACKIQKKLIPSESPADYIHIFYKPMKQVGGDFFDFLRFRNSSKIGIFVSDVAGHGIPAAFITSMVKSFILQSGAVRENPADLLYYLNNLLINQTADYFVTAFYGIFDPSTRHFIYASAGHNPPFLIFKDRVELLEGKTSLPLAVFDNKEMIDFNIEIVNNELYIPGDCSMLLYTDGLVEERNSSNLQFQYGPLTDVLLESRNHKGMDFIQNLYQNLVDFSGSDSFYDDVCLIFLDITE